MIVPSAALAIPLVRVVATFASASLVLLALALAAVHAPGAEAATVRRINKDKTRLIVKLSKEELATVEDGEAVLLEFERPRFVLPATLSKLDPVKQTVVMVFELPDERFVQGMPLRFLPLFRNAPTSPLITDYAQYHQYVRTHIGAAGGGSYAQWTGSTSEQDTKTKVTGTRFRVDGYALVDPSWLGLGLTFEQRRLTFAYESERTVTVGVGADATSETSESSSETSYTINKLSPGLWVQLESHWRVGASYHLYTIEEEDDSSLFNHELGTPELSVLRFFRDFEWGVDYRSKAESEATDTLVDELGTTEVNSKVQLPADVWTFARWATSPALMWGTGLGWTFYEREDQGAGLSEKAEPLELLRLRLSLEHRLDSGSKFDWALYFAGDKSTVFSSVMGAGNRGGLHVGYLRPIGEETFASLSFDVEGGSLAKDNESTDPTTGETTTDKETTASYGAALLIGVVRELDLREKQPGGRTSW